MVQIRNSTNSTMHRNFSNQTSTQPKSSQLPYAIDQSKRKTTMDSFEPSQRKRSKNNDLSANSISSSIHNDGPSTSTTLPRGHQQIQNKAPEFSPYRARRPRNNQNSTSQHKSSQALRREQQQNKKRIRIDDYNDFDDNDDQENDLNSSQNFTTQHKLNQSLSRKQQQNKKRIRTDDYNDVDDNDDQENDLNSSQYIQPDGGENHLDELQSTQKQSRMRTNYYANQKKHHSLNLIDEEDIPDENDEDDNGMDRNQSELVYENYFNKKFDQLKGQLVNTTNTLAGDVQSQLVSMNKQLKSLSKSVQDNSLNPTLAIYQNLSFQHPKVVEFNGVNLLSICKTTDYKKYARTILKIMFTPDELSNSILYSNPMYSRPGLDPNRMTTWEEAVCARFKIDKNRFEDFFRTCLRRTLGQMLCDIRRTQKKSLNNHVRQRRSTSSPTASPVQHNPSAHRTSPPGVLRSRDGLINRNVLD